MLKKLPVFLLVVLLAAGIQAQVTTILDFESAATTTTFQYFGSSIDGQQTVTLANPNPTGANTSANVLEFRKPAGAQTWAGAFSNPNPVTAVSVPAGSKVTILFHSDHIGNLTLKLENSSDGGPNWLQTQANTVVNGWEKLEFDVAIPSAEPPNQPAGGHIYQTVTLFVDFGVSPSADQVSYIDDIQVEIPVSCTTILDFENPATSTAFQYFGSSIDGQLGNTLANPNPTGINTSATVYQFSKPANSQVWAGAFSNPSPSTPLVLNDGGIIKIKVHSDHVGNLAFKLEDSPDGGPNWILQQPIEVANEWVELSFDPSLPSIEGPNEPAAGHTYNRVVLFFDFGTAFPNDQTYYFDDIQVCGGGGIPSADVTFTVNMNQYGSAFSNVYVSGTFNSWAGDANQLSDADGDGIYSTTLSLPVGLYEYKFTLDNWAAQENLDITSACAQVTFAGSDVFVNRKLALSGDTELDPVCFNSCYACGESVKINYALGLNGATADPGGVYLAGGAEFGAPNPRFRMYDDDLDNVYTLQIERQRGYGGYFTFTNGACADFSCKEIIAGLSCAHPENFNDRFLSPVQQDTTLATCLATCATASDCTSSAPELAGPGAWMEVMPTLTSQEVRILFRELTQSKARVQITDLTGRIVWQQQWNLAPSQVNLPVADWNKGMYLITAENGGRRITGRFVKM